jgi:hypothetical protein
VNCRQMWISTTRHSFIPKYARSLLHRYTTATRILHELSCSARWPHPHPRLTSVTVSRTTPVINNSTYVLVYDQKVPASNGELIVSSVAGLELGYIGRHQSALDPSCLIRVERCVGIISTISYEVYPTHGHMVCSTDVTTPCVRSIACIVP